MSDSKTPLLSDRVYNFLKPIATTVLPALATLYAALAQVWDFPAPEQVVVTITAVNTFLGVLLGLSSKSYNSSGAAYDGDLYVITDSGGEKNLVLGVENDIHDVAGKSEVRLRVEKK